MDAYTWCPEKAADAGQPEEPHAEVALKGTISRQQERVSVEFDLKEWSYLKSIILFARKAANGPLFANDGESPQIERFARSLLDELGFERHD